MFEKMNEFCWNELHTTNVKKSKEFYEELFGWKAEDIKCGDIEYTLFKKDKTEVAGLMLKPEKGKCSCKKEGKESKKEEECCCGKARWLSYVTVEDVDKMVKKVEQLHGEVLFKPMDVEDVGRIAVVKDNMGAVIGFITPSKK